MSEIVKSRRAAREAAFQAVYQCVCGGGSIDAAVTEALGRRTFSPEAAAFVRELGVGTVTGVSEIDARYSPFLKSGWTPDRLALVDRLVLRLAVFELWGMPEIPPKVTITEAVELAKRFGGADSGSFINGVLGRVLQVSPKAGWTGEAAEVADVSEPEDVGEQSGTSEEPEHSWTLSSDE